MFNCSRCRRVIKNSNQMLCEWCKSDLISEGNLLIHKEELTKKTVQEGLDFAKNGYKAQIQDLKQKQEFVKYKEKELHIKCPDVERELKKRHYLSALNLLEQMIEEAKKLGFLDVIDWIQKQISFVSDQMREESSTKIKYKAQLETLKKTKN